MDHKPLIFLVFQEGITITSIGINLAKKVFQVHGVDAEGKASPGSSDARRCWRSSPSWRRVWSAWRPVAVPRVGDASMAATPVFHHVRENTGCGFYGRRIGGSFGSPLRRYRLSAGHGARRDLFFESATMKTKAASRPDCGRHAAAGYPMPCPRRLWPRQRVMIAEKRSASAAVSGCMRADQTLNPIGADGGRKEDLLRRVFQWLHDSAR